MQVSYQRAFVNSKDEKILLTLFSLQEKHKKPYSFPSQQKIITLCRSYYGLVMGRRSLNYHLRYLENQGFITRRRRIGRLTNGTLYLSTSLYFLTARAFNYLKGMCKFVVGILKSRPSWTKQFQLKDQIKVIEQEQSPAVRQSKYLEVIYDTLS